MDPGTIIDLSTMVISICNDYRTMKDDIKTIVGDLNGFLGVLQQLQDVTKTGHTEGAAQSAYDDLIKSGGVLTGCQADLVKLQAKLKPMKKFKSFLLTLTWPFVKGDVADALNSLEKKKATLNTALHVIQLSLAQSARQTVLELAKNANDAKNEELRNRIHQWLTAPDPAVNYEAALHKRTAETGTWLINDRQYKEWKDGSKPFLWIHGMAGCGKSVLCSTVIEDLKKGSDKPQVALGYYFFDFNNPSKQECNNLLRSLVAQLFRAPAMPNALLALYKKCNDGQQRPLTDDLLETLHKMLDDYQQVFIVMDALDECKEQKLLLKLLEKVVKWKHGTLHIFATSRREPDIERDLKLLVSAQINIQSSIIDQDIQKFVDERLQDDNKLSIWGDEKKKDIMKALLEGANGMFQWAVCQLDMLRNCHSSSDLKNALGSLPKTLDETYERILLKISEEDQKNALCILQWVAFAMRPITIGEISEALAIDFDSDLPSFDVNKRWHKPEDILQICVNLVIVETIDDEIESTNVLRLSHFSVQEYLVSERIRKGPAGQYWFSEQLANIFISQCCLAYLLQFNTPYALDEEKMEDFPLAYYAGKQWMYHAQSDNKGSSDILQNLIMMLFQPLCSHWSHWMAIENVYEYSSLRYISLETTAGPIYYASFYGLEMVLNLLLLKGENVNAKGGEYGNALQAASYKKNEKIVQLLLANGANINAQGGEYGNALQAASSQGNEQIVQLLLAKGADVNAQRCKYGDALYIAVWKKHERIVQLLLAKGADVNAQEGYYGNALQAASAQGNEYIVQLLLANGADVNAQGGQYGNALQAASSQGNEQIVQLLLAKGADVNAQGGEYGNALYAAVWSKLERIVQLLLANGADINAQGGQYGNALQSASSQGNEQIVQLLLAKGADVNAQGGYYGNALQAVSSGGNKQIVQLLLAKGADVNAQGGQCGNALQAASSQGNEEIVQLLLAKGADVNAQGGGYGNALHAAVCREHKRIVQLLLANGADVNAQGGYFGNTLQAASSKGNEQIVQLLLAKGADVNAQGGQYKNALQAAIENKQQNIVDILLSRRALQQGEASK